MEANTVAAAAVLWRRDKTTLQVLKKTPKNSSFGVPSLSLSLYSPPCLYLSCNDPSSFPCCKHVHVTIWATA